MVDLSIAMLVHQRVSDYDYWGSAPLWGLTPQKGQRFAANPAEMSQISSWDLMRLAGSAKVS